ncbi:hypothetical protein chiPu_0020710 [Chiloscyllium punctatum]|uniref:Uncharacterized protein n=1 Tax=Chiloscyllium punctatum TaxID=137246 RepID=A0A401RIU6_CHIPU|nr:hypothetical protein [Chiloscyllium punctatum]
MTLNKTDRSRALERRRGSTPLHAHRRSMPVDERELCASLQAGTLSNLVRCTSYNPGQASQASHSSESLSSSGSDSDSSLYKVVLLGEHRVGKSSLARIFGGLEESEPQETEGRGDTFDRSMVVDGEEANLLLFDIWEQVGLCYECC